MKKELTKPEILKLLKKAGEEKRGRGYTQKDIADFLHVSKSHVSMVLKGSAKSQRITDMVGLLIGEPIIIKAAKKPKSKQPNLT